MAGKAYSVVAEFADGTTKTVSVRGESSGEAYRQVRDIPGVRRVGRVTEGVATIRPVPQSNGSPRPPAPPAPARPPAREAEPPRHEPSTAIGHAMTGPRTVLYAPPKGGGELPFRHLKAPPERPKPAPEPPRVEAPPTVPVAQDVPADQSAMAIPELPGTEYRIVKSRRRDGQPYLLQRGNWRQAGGKRLFDVAWEKGFAEPAKAEQHLEWIKHAENEMAGLHQSA